MNRTRKPPAFLMRDADPKVVGASALGQLRRRLRLRRDHAKELNHKGLALLDAAIVSAVLECREAGVGLEARKVLKELR